MKMRLSIAEGLECIANGGVIAYPTEAVYGLGCDAWNESAVLKLLTLKQRPIEKGLIVLIHDWDALFPLIGEVSQDCLARVKSTWPGPVTWVFPKSTKVPYYLTGNHPSIAIRMSAHPIARALSKYGPIVSTSANEAGFEPFREADALELAFLERGLDGIVEGSLGELAQPTTILDVLTQQKWR